MDSNMFILLLVIENLVYSILFYLLLRKYIGVGSVMVVPIYSVILSFTRLSPIFIDSGFGHYIVFLLSLFNYLLLCIIRFRENVIIYGLLYYFHYFFLGIAPYIFLNCPILSTLCMYTRLSNPLSLLLVFITGFIIMVFLNSITTMLEDHVYRFHMFIMTLYLSSIYASLLETLVTDIALPFIILSISAISYYVGLKSGEYLYLGLDVDKIFDKYVSINAVLLFMFISFLSVYAMLW